MEEEIVQRCDICGSNEYTKFECVSNNVVCCLKCNYIYLSVRPSQDEIIKFYNRPDQYQKEVQNRESRLIMWQRRFSDLKNWIKEGNCLDIGCGIGTFLYLAKENGFSVYGTEISSVAINYAKSLYKLNIHHGTLDTIKFENEFFDLITLWYVFEHLPSPKNTLERIKEILKPGGIVVITVPNHNCWRMYIRKLLRSRVYSSLLDNQEIHLSFFTVPVLEFLLKENSFEILDISNDYYEKPNFWTDFKYKIGKLYIKLTKKYITSTIRIIARKIK